MNQIDISSPSIAFVTAHHFGIQALKGLIDSNHFKEEKFKLNLVVTLDAVRRQDTVGFSDDISFIQKLKIPHHTIDYSKELELYNLLYKAAPDFICVIGWSRLIPENILKIPAMKHNNTTDLYSEKFGCVGMHPTLLPIGRGRAPIPWTIINGLKNSGVSSFFLEKTADSGNIIDQYSFPIADDEDANSLFTKCSVAHYQLGLNLADKLAKKHVESYHQNLVEVSVWSKRTPEDGKIHSEMSVDDVDRLIRATTYPYPGAFFTINGIKIIVDKAMITEMETIEDSTSGEIIGLTDDNHYPIVRVKNGVFSCTQLRGDIDTTIFKIGGRIDE